MKLIVTNKNTGAIDCFDACNVSISFSDGYTKGSGDQDIVEIPNGVTMKNFVISQVCDIDVGDLIIANVIGKIAVFRMNVTQYSSASGKKFRTKVNKYNDLIIKRLR